MSSSWAHDHSPSSPEDKTTSHDDEGLDVSPSLDSADPGSSSEAKRRKLNAGRTSQACLPCRRKKMRCDGANNPPCHRCRRTGTSCDFVPRANAARPWSPGPYPSHQCTELWRTEVNQRLKDVETTNVRLESIIIQLQAQIQALTAGAGANAANGSRLTTGHGHPVPPPPPHAQHPNPTRDRSRGRQSNHARGRWGNGPGEGLGIDLGHASEEREPQSSQSSRQLHSSQSSRPPHSSQSSRTPIQVSIQSRNNPGYDGALDAVGRLCDELPHHLASSDAFSPSTVCKLWDSFRSQMPGLHFLPASEVSFDNPTPLLAVAILYVAAAHYPSADLARHGSLYMQSFTRAISTLAVPDSLIRGLSKFDNVLGIILVGLLAVGWVDTLGMWVNTAYRILLDGVTEDRGKRQNGWRGLWEGLRTVELEHSSLHLITPALPHRPPQLLFPGQQDRNPGQSIGELLAIMQRRMPRFVGRGLPTLWDTVCTNLPKRIGNDVELSVQAEDMQEIRTWASEIDAWYRRSAAEARDANNYDRTIVFLNYYLHKLFVLSIFFPLRGNRPISASESTELLEAARTVLRIEASGFEVWSSWDLVIVTNASLILLQAWASGAADQQDLNLIQNHLNMLMGTHQSAPSLRHTLSSTLETALQQVRTPVQPPSVPLPQSVPVLVNPSPSHGQNPSQNPSQNTNPNPTANPNPNPNPNPATNQSQDQNQNQAQFGPLVNTWVPVLLGPTFPAPSQQQPSTQHSQPLFMGQAADLLPDLTFDFSEPAEWPRLLDNFLGEGVGVPPEFPGGA